MKKSIQYSIILFITVSLLSHSIVFSQDPQKLTLEAGYQLSIDTPSEIILPPNYDPAKKYPLLVFLPATGGMSRDLYEGYVRQALNITGNEPKSPFGFNNSPSTEQMMDLTPLMDSLGRQPTNKEINDYIEKKFMSLVKTRMKANEQSISEEDKIKNLQEALFGEKAKEKAFIVMLPGGEGSTKDHDWKGFSACIHRYETRVLQDIETYSKQYSIDQSNIILTGFSLGGDLSWAISHRYPEKFKGAAIAGTRCSYYEKGRMERQLKNGVHYFMAIGNSEMDAIVKGMTYATTLLKQTGIPYKFQRMPGGHVELTFEQFQEGLNFVMFNK